MGRRRASTPRSAKYLATVARWWPTLEAISVVRIEPGRIGARSAFAARRARSTAATRAGGAGSRGAAAGDGSALSTPSQRIRMSSSVRPCESISTTSSVVPPYRAASLPAYSRIGAMPFQWWGPRPPLRCVSPRRRSFARRHSRQSPQRHPFDATMTSSRRARFFRRRRGLCITRWCGAPYRDATEGRHRRQEGMRHRTCELVHTPIHGGRRVVCVSLDGLDIEIWEERDGATSSPPQPSSAPARPICAPSTPRRRPTS